MRSLILLLGVCTFVCVAYAAPADLSFIEKLLDKVTSQDDDDDDDADAQDALAFIEALGKLIQQDTQEKAKKQFNWKGLAHHGIDLLGK